MSTTAVRTVPIIDLTCDPRLQMRAELDQEVIREYKRAYKEGAKFPPIIVFESGTSDGSTLLVVDGFHRLAARKQTGDSIRCEVHSGSFDDALRYAIETANTKHGLRYTTKDKQRRITACLQHPELGSKSDREVAKICGATDKTVTKIREELGLSGQYRTSTGGKVVPPRKSNVKAGSSEIPKTTQKSAGSKVGSSEIPNDGTDDRPSRSEFPHAKVGQPSGKIIQQAQKPAKPAPLPTAPEPELETEDVFDDEAEDPSFNADVIDDSPKLPSPPRIVLSDRLSPPSAAPTPTPAVKTRKQEIDELIASMPDIGDDDEEPLVVQAPPPEAAQFTLSALEGKARSACGAYIKALIEEKTPAETMDRIVASMLHVVHQDIEGTLPEIAEFERLLSEVFPGTPPGKMARLAWKICLAIIVRDVPTIKGKLDAMT